MWDDCRSIQEAFTSRLDARENELCGSRAIHLNLARDKPEKAVWRKAVLSNLGTSEANISNMSSVLVARNHWSYAQLEFFETNQV
jgi:hypothetical protein